MMSIIVQFRWNHSAMFQHRIYSSHHNVCHVSVESSFPTSVLCPSHFIGRPIRYAEHIPNSFPSTTLLIQFYYTSHVILKN